jgi:hypothetical protein
VTTIAQNFDANWKEDTNGCWIWQRARNNQGYGVLGLKGKIVLAHRFSYEKFKEHIPDGFLVCHQCDNPACVNPDHLWLGTDKDNQQDGLRKGRGRRGIHRGEQNVTAKLTDRDVLTIRRRYAEGEIQEDIANDYGLHKTNVQCICSYKTWKHLP